MEYRKLSSSEYKKLSYEEQQKYLQLLYDNIHSDDEEDLSIRVDNDSEEEWLPDEYCNDSDVEDAITKPDIEFEDEDADENVCVEENENNEDSSSQEIHSRGTFVGKDGTEWNSKPLGTQKILRHNILREKAGPVRVTQNLSILETFKCIFSNEMCDVLIREINRKAHKVYCKYYIEQNPSKPQKQWKTLTAEDFDAITTTNCQECALE